MYAMMLHVWKTELSLATVTYVQVEWFVKPVMSSPDGGMWDVHVVVQQEKA